MPFEWPHPEFRFRSGRDWEQVPTDDESQLQLYCPETKTAVTLSMEAYQVPPEKFEKVARFILESRKNAHVEGIKRISGNDDEPQLHYEYERLKPHSSGTGYEIAYEGSHQSTSFFGYLGYVTSRKVVNLFVETPISFSPGRREMFREVVNGFDIKLP